MLNLVLVQTGKIFRDPDLHNPQNAGLTRRRISEFVPPANDRFHDALDEIEIEILQAKAIIERDLSRIRKKCADIEHHATEFATPSSSTDQKLPEDNLESTAIGIPEAGDGREGNVEDAIMADAVAQIAEQSKDEASAKEQKTMDQEGTITAMPGMPQDSQNSTGLAISIPQEARPSDLGALANAHKVTTEASQADLENSAAANGASEATMNDNFDFDSMFNDAELVASDDPMNFDLDFSASGNETQQLLGDTAIEGITMSNKDIANALPTTSEDLNSLLPGLENYVNATNDAATNNAAARTMTMPEANQAAGADTTGATTQAATELAPAESNFDNFFNPADFNVPEGIGSTGEVVGDGNFEGFEEFNDDWFKME
ncbi:MAG: hypothetical protein Q9217_003321 [Psora testacea]